MAVACIRCFLWIAWNRKYKTRARWRCSNESSKCDRFGRWARFSFEFIIPRLTMSQYTYTFTVLAFLWPVIGRATVVAKKELFYAFPFGPAAYLWGTLFINRSNKSDAVNRLNQESIAIQQQAAKLLFFPEGTRHQGDSLLPFKKGAFHIAVQSQSYIQPVVISRYWFLDSKMKLFDRGKQWTHQHIATARMYLINLGFRYFLSSYVGHSIIHILPEISCHGLGADDISDLLEKVQSSMQIEFTKLNTVTKTMSSSVSLSTKEYDQ